MTNRDLAILLIEKLADANIDKKIAVYLNRLLLRFHSHPAILANLADVTAFKPGIEGTTDDQVEDGKFNEDVQKPPEAMDASDKPKGESDPNSTVLIQLSFRRLPQEVMSPLLRLIAAPRSPKLYRFTKDGQARTGIQIELKPNDFPGEDIDYAF